MKRNVILTCDQKPTRVRLVYSTEQQQTGENRKSGRLRVKTDMLRSIPAGKQLRKTPRNYVLYSVMVVAMVPRKKIP